MNIVFLLRPWPVYGGGETVTVLLANEFVKRGIGVHVLYTKDSPKEKKRPFLDNRITSCKVEGIISDEDCHTFKKHETIKAKLFLDKYIQSNDIDIVINQWWPVGAIKGCHAKVITCLHMCLFMTAGYDNLSYSGIDLFKRLLGRKLYTYLHKLSRSYQVERVLPFVDKYLFLSPRFKDDYLSFRPNTIFREKLDYCFNPLVINNNSIKNIESKKKKVLFVGRMYDIHKRVSIIIDLWNDIEKDKQFEEWSLELVGDGPDLNKYKEMVKINGLQRVCFHGFQSPDLYYRECSVFLMTSTFEGWPMTLLESQSHGVVPIVYDTFSSVHDIIESGKNGFIIKEGDRKDYLQKLRLLMANDDQRNEMALTAYQTCRRFSVDNVVNRWMKIFNQIM